MSFNGLTSVVKNIRNNLLKTEMLTVEKDFRHGENWVSDEPKFMTNQYGPPETYRSGVVRRNTAGSWDAFIKGKCVRQTVGKKGAFNAIDSRTPQDLFS